MPARVRDLARWPARRRAAPSRTIARRGECEVVRVERARPPDGNVVPDRGAVAQRVARGAF